MSKLLTMMTCIAGAILALFIPFWYAPFLLAFIFALSLKKIPPYFLLFHFLIYTMICLLYCFIVQSFGSQDLVRRIGEIFLGIPPVLLALVSSFFYGLNAFMGAWIGKSVKNIMK